ncbi:hypothetical protein EPYR_04017 (plasmid) [Erwinia pyrifoliae DSM 12163]|nr:hypothetical protein EPYR_04017 [Erwinia pyrifoliae DSM 12163]
MKGGKSVGSINKFSGFKVNHCFRPGFISSARAASYQAMPHPFLFSLYITSPMIPLYFQL